MPRPPSTAVSTTFAASTFTAWDRLRRPVWVFDPVTCRGLYANAPALELWGAADLDELLGRDFSQLSPAVRTRTERLALGTADGGTMTEVWTFYPRGAPVTVEAVISTIALEGGGAALLFEAAAADVQEEERRAVEALRHTSSLISLFDPSGRSLFTNPAAFAAHGADGFVERFFDSDQGADAFAQVLDGEVLSELLQVRTAKGERSHHIDARRVLDPISGRASVLLSAQDVTAQVEAERALQLAHERAEVAEAKERFLAIMSHELRTPLNTVIGFAGLLGAGGLDATQAGHVGRIAEAGQSLLGMVNDVITISELDTGAVTPDAAPFDPEAMLRAAAGEFGGRIAAKGLALKIEVEPAGLPSVVGDAERLKTVVQRYLANAIKFTEQGEITLRLQASAAGGDAAALEVSVLDTGIGLDEEVKGRLFRRFSQGDESRGRKFGGGGLGLAISKQVIELMGGEVGADGAPGEGSRFWFRLTLPLAATAATADDDLDAANDDEGDAGGALSVLYADDHENNRALVQAVLASQGHRCDTVADGAEAVRAVRACAYDLVLMDIQMPVQDGVSATLEIRALPGAGGAVPIVAVTANTLANELETYAAAGMNDCVAKPVNMGELLMKAAYWGSANLADDALEAG